MSEDFYFTRYFFLSINHINSLLISPSSTLCHKLQIISNAISATLPGEKYTFFF